MRTKRVPGMRTRQAPRARSHAIITSGVLNQEKIVSNMREKIVFYVSVL